MLTTMLTACNIPESIFENFPREYCKHIPKVILYES